MKLFNRDAEVLRSGSADRPCSLHLLNFAPNRFSLQAFGSSDESTRDRSCTQEARRSGNCTISGRLLQDWPGRIWRGGCVRGIKVPGIRALARTHKAQTLAVLEAWLDSGIHEVRLLALVVLANRFARAPEGDKKAIVELYLRKRAASTTGTWSMPPPLTFWAGGSARGSRGAV